MIYGTHKSCCAAFCISLKLKFHEILYFRNPYIFHPQYIRLSIKFIYKVVYAINI